MSAARTTIAIRMPKTLPALVLVAAAIATHADSQEPAAWGDELTFHTFSIAAIDPETGEAGVAVSTRNPCVGNGVPWVRAGVGAVATQARTRTDYGDEILDMMAEGVSAEEALGRSIASDEQAANRQIGVIGLKGGTAAERASDRSYGLKMAGLFAEAACGPMHAGRAVTIEGDARFDSVVLVYYPGIDFIQEMLYAFDRGHETNSGNLLDVLRFGPHSHSDVVPTVPIDRGRSHLGPL